MQPVKRLKRLPAPPGAFEPYQSTREASVLQQQSAPTLPKLAEANFQQLDQPVLKPPRLKAAPPSKPYTNKMTSVPPSVPIFMLADVKQIVAQAIQTALIKALRSLPANNCPIANLTPTTAF